MSEPAKPAIEAFLRTIDWNSNVADFLANAECVRKADAAALRSAIWSRQIEASDIGNPALPFVRECQANCSTAISLIALALYRPAAAAMRSMFESALYYTYFRSHPVELATLLRGDRYFAGREDIIEYHLEHTPDFAELQGKLDFNARLKRWYGSMSRLIHSQIPGSWIEHTAKTGIVHCDAILLQAISDLESGAELVHRLYLCTIAKELWNDFESGAKKHILRGLSGDLKAQIGLDSA